MERGVITFCDFLIGFRLRSKTFMKIHPYLITILIYFCAIELSAQEKMHITEQLLHGTIRIEAIDGKKHSAGTGFFFNYYTDSLKSITIPVIITNKHVIEGFKTIRLFFKREKNNEPEYGAPYIVDIPNNTSTVILHPNINVDLVAIPTAKIFADLSERGISIFYIAANEDIIPDDHTQKLELKSIEEIWMIGYPNGLWDAKNNLPIVRKGITATTPYLDYNGKREFLIDVAAFAGSSGSPIIYYRDFYTDKNTYAPKIGLRLYLLGVLYAGPIYTVEGKVIKTSPNEPTMDTKTQIPMNLGYVIKASEILEFKRLLIH